VDHQYKQHPSITGRLVDGQFTPAPESLDADVTVWLALPPGADDVQVWEGLAARKALGNDRVEVLAVPLFAYDVNYGDELSVVASAEGPLVATGVTKDRGNYTFRVWLPASALDGAAQEVANDFGLRGCLIERYSERLIGLSCGPSEAQAVADALYADEERGRFIYETGRQRASCSAWVSKVELKTR
jgi:hypothetical protein